MEGLAKMKVAGEDCTAILDPSLPPVPLPQGTLFYATVNRLTEQAVKIRDENYDKVHGAWWDVGKQTWIEGWADCKCLLWR